MPITNCFAEINKSIAMDCSHPLVGGYTGRALLIKFEDDPTLTINSANPRTLEGVTLASGKKAIAISNIIASPFNGSATSGNQDSGRVMFDKSFAVRIPLRGSDNSKNVVEALVNSAQGYLLIAEKKDKVGNGSFEVAGLQVAMRVTDPTTVTRNEYENGGDVLMTISTQESWFEESFYLTSYSATKALFDTLWNGAEA